MVLILPAALTLPFVLYRRRRVRQKHHREADEVSGAFFGAISALSNSSERPEIAPPLSVLGQVEPPCFKRPRRSAGDLSTSCRPLSEAAEGRAGASLRGAVHGQGAETHDYRDRAPWVLGPCHCACVGV